jgi:excisionase family DNA binding protein
MKMYERNTNAVSNNSERVWKQIRTTIEEVATEKLNQQTLSQTNPRLPEKVLLKASDVCEILQVSKPTLYEWLKQNRLKSFKFKSRRYFSRANIDAIIRGEETTISNKI